MGGKLSLPCYQSDYKALPFGLNQFSSKFVCLLFPSANKKSRIGINRDVIGVNGSNATWMRINIELYLVYETSET